MAEPVLAFVRLLSQEGTERCGPTAGTPPPPAKPRSVSVPTEEIRQEPCRRRLGRGVGLFRAAAFPEEVGAKQIEPAVHSLTGSG